MRYLLVALLMLFGAVNAATAQVSLRIGTPGLSIGFNVPVFPQFVRIPGYPVYYAPRLRGNYFFYDGAYWLFSNGRWYVSTWYNGPWRYVDPYNVPLFILRIPVRYYTRPPRFFYGWRRDQPPLWGRYWGHQWEQRRRGWNHWDRRAVYPPAPLPRYQRNYSGRRYPYAIERQRELERRHYRYQPREPMGRRRYEQQRQRSLQQRQRSLQQRRRYEQQRQRSLQQRRRYEQQRQRSLQQRRRYEQQRQRSLQQRRHPQQQSRRPQQKGQRKDQNYGRKGRP